MQGCARGLQVGGEGPGSSCAARRVALCVPLDGDGGYVSSLAPHKLPGVQHLMGRCPSPGTRLLRYHNAIACLAPWGTHDRKIRPAMTLFRSPALPVIRADVQRERVIVSWQLSLRRMEMVEED